MSDKTPHNEKATPDRQTRVILSIELDWFGRGIVSGIQDYNQRNQSSWAFLMQGLGLLGSGSFLEQVRLHEAEGLIAQIGSPALEKAVRRSGIPAVHVGGHGPPPAAVPAVLIDHVRTGERVAEYLLDRGFRQLAFYGQNGTRYSDERERAFRRTIQDAGQACWSYVPRRLPVSRRGWDRRMDELARWLNRLPKPVGIMAISDGHAWQLLTACQHLQLRVPDDVAVIGVNNDDLVCTMTVPPLSSVAIVPERVGYEAAALLERQMQGASVPDAPILVPPGEIVTRRSTDTLSIEDPVTRDAVRFIREHAHEPIQVEDVLARFPISRRSLERRFAKSLGRSPLAEIRRARLERARKLLAETSWPIPKVAAASGFSDADYFGTIFAREIGLTPSRYRKLNSAC